MRLRGVSRPDMGTSKAMLAGERKAIQQDLAMDLADQFLKSVRKELPVTVDDEFLQTMASTEEQ